MIKKLDLSRYKELLELEPWEKDWFTDPIFNEFLSYEATILSQVHYNRKEDYFLLIYNYLIGILNSDQFRSKFSKMKWEDSENASTISQDFEALENFFIGDDLEIFSGLIIKISDLCFGYEEILDDGTGKRMTAMEFYSLVNSRYFQIQRAFPAISSKKLPY